MRIPQYPLQLMTKVYKDIFPIVHRTLNKWREQAENIPDPELRKQALSSIDEKTFHCEGGSIFSIIASPFQKDCIEFIVAYQTISDYLDNLCDRSHSLDPNDFRMLHYSMSDALTVGAETKNYYQCREEQQDGGYLANLVKECQNKLATLKHYHLIKPHLLELNQYYCDLQVHKHVIQEERVPRLENWFKSYKDRLPKMEWYEFSACTGSTIGIFCLVAYAFQDQLTSEIAKQIKGSYFPYIQGLHILLDYLIDQEEDRKEGDLNFCSYFSNERQMLNRLEHFVKMADKQLKGIPHERFHRLINRGLLGVYLSDEKVTSQKKVSKLARKLIWSSGGTSLFFYLNGRAYRTVQKIGFS
ncbi:tetraprenyl-beta-curcumene synthase family protein [Bacillus carboniphilus]|uniref:Tetraprenyl-beta-curcumene synthase family protein n=1 Tax=Bacillus carboniphilus TaxID=86663 RepID=A0ABY9JRR5_9BACI|nr:tetraprenyl-beta-curcumene synthase family protein [Bacillus carboniphilus]WLR41173.1 tetraprenyl-beta-curcumene synthase family protein [Bacillus carboniphilus]